MHAPLWQWILLGVAVVPFAVIARDCWLTSKHGARNAVERGKYAARVVARPRRRVEDLTWMLYREQEAQRALAITKKRNAAIVEQFVTRGSGEAA